MDARTEAEIMKHWPTNCSRPVASIVCLTFNHRDYIGQAIDGFLRQQTDFPSRSSSTTTPRRWHPGNPPGLRAPLPPADPPDPAKGKPVQPGQALWHAGVPARPRRLHRLLRRRRLLERSAQAAAAGGLPGEQPGLRPDLPRLLCLQQHGGSSIRSGSMARITTIAAKPT